MRAIAVRILHFTLSRAGALAGCVEPECHRPVIGEGHRHICAELPCLDWNVQITKG